MVFEVSIRGPLALLTVDPDILRRNIMTGVGVEGWEETERD